MVVGVLHRRLQLRTPDPSAESRCGVQATADHLPRRVLAQPQAEPVCSSRGGTTQPAAVTLVEPSRHGVADLPSPESGCSPFYKTDAGGGTEYAD